MASTLQRVLDLWRASERELAAQQPESRNISAVTTQIDRLRRLYQTVTIHERRDLRELKGPDRTIVQAESLAVRSRAAADQAADAVERARTTRLEAAVRVPPNPRPPEQAAVHRP
jgi:hypothetical protein